MPALGGFSRSATVLAAWDVESLPAYPSCRRKWRFFLEEILLLALVWAAGDLTILMDGESNSPLGFEFPLTHLQPTVSQQRNRSSRPLADAVNMLCNLSYELLKGYLRIAPAKQLNQLQGLPNHQSACSQDKEPMFGSSPYLLAANVVCRLVEALSTNSDHTLFCEPSTPEGLTAKIEACQAHQTPSRRFLLPCASRVLKTSPPVAKDRGLLKPPGRVPVGSTARTISFRLGYLKLPH